MSQQIKTFEDLKQAKLRGAKVFCRLNSEWGWDELEQLPTFRSTGAFRQLIWRGSPERFAYWHESGRVEEPVAELKSECVPDPLPLPAPKNLRNGGSQYRKDRPMFSGFISYFPDAIAEASLLSKKGRDKHNPGGNMYWLFDSSSDHLDCQVRHMVDHDEIDEETQLLEAGANLWRAAAHYQTLLEKRDPALHAFRSAQRERQAKGER